MRKRKTIQSPLGSLTLVEEDGALVQLSFDGYTAVSYTHLDVYKRQEQGSRYLRFLQSGGLFRHVSGSMSHNSGSRLTSLRCSEPSFCGDQMGGCHLSLWMALYGPHRNFYRDRRTTSCGRICGGTPDRTAAVFRGAWLLETVASLLPKS